jgi:hypothetical protein
MLFSSGAEVILLRTEAVVIDGTAHRVHRPQDATEPREKYSEKERSYCEDDLIIDIEEHLVLYLSQTFPFLNVFMTKACVMKKTTRFRPAVSP